MFLGLTSIKQLEQNNYGKILKKGGDILNKKDELDIPFIMSTVLNILFLVGLTFLVQLENLYVLIPYTILIFINAVYLVVKAINITKNRSWHLGEFETSFFLS